MISFYYSDMFNNPRFSFMPHDKRKTLKLEVQIRNALYHLTILITTMNDELSLVPVSVLPESPAR
jgi:hypothetical protein